MSNAVLFKMHNEQDILFNLFGDYTYLTEGYYRSLEGELEGVKIIPTTEEALDAYVVPLAMVKAEMNNIPIPLYEIVTEKIVPPVLAYPINPYTSKFEVITDTNNLKSKLNTVTMSGKYATLCQRLPEDYRIDIIRCILGKSLVKEYEHFAQDLFQVFRVPLMKIRVIVTPAQYLFSAVEPFLFDELTLKEKKIIEELGTWQN
ncbi:MAG: RimK-like ATPgrasp N-terminal domain-containing protein [Peptococcaceae bacterium]